MAAYNASVECLNFKFEDTPEGEFVETVIAAQGQLERLQNRRQTLQKALLKELQPTEKLFRLARAMFEDLWNHRLESAAEKEKTLRAELEKTQRSVDQFLDRIADAQLPSVITVYENRIRKLEERRMELSEKIANCGRPLRSFDESLRTALDFLSNPMKLWISERLANKRTVLKLAFAERLAYTRNEGLRTAVPALPFKVLADMKSGKSKLVRPRGETSNSLEADRLFETLAVWDQDLRQARSSGGFC